MKYIDADKLIAEIERRKKAYDAIIESQPGSNRAERAAWKWAECKSILSFIDTLEWQKPVEWSEEDEKMLYSIIEVLEVMPSARFIPIKREIMIPWLESLRPQPHWKPSKEQMEALWDAYKGGKEQEPLREVIEQLKKLM